MIDHSDTMARPSPSRQPTSSLTAHSTYSSSNPLPRHVDLCLDFEEEKNPDGTLIVPARARCRLRLKDWRWKDRRRMNDDGTESACVLDEGEEFIIDRGVLGEGDDGATGMRVIVLIRAEVKKYKMELVKWGVI